MRCDRAIEAAVAALPNDTLIAFSGGGDSAALLAACAARGLRYAAIVDHQIQADSRCVAEEARAFGETLGVACRIIVLSWPDGPPKDHARARRARYVALAQVAQMRGFKHIATAHTRDDQAETILIRHSAQSGLRGLAGMHAHAPFPVWPEGRGLFLLRPLLPVSRADLRAWLEARGLRWREDPANADLRFARVRARTVLQANPSLAARLIEVSTRAAARAAHLDAQALALIERHVAIDATGAAKVDRSAWCAASLLVRRRVFAVLLQAISGKEAGPETAALNALTDRVATPPAGAATLGGAYIAWTQQTLVLSVDPGLACGRRDQGQTAPTPVPLGSGEIKVWQGRFEVQAERRVSEGTFLAPGLGGAPLIVSAASGLTLEEAVAAGHVSNWRSLARDRLDSLLYRGKFTSA